MWSRAPAKGSERAVIDGDAACTHGSPTSARAYVGSWSHRPPFQDPPSAGIHFPSPRTSLKPVVPACWISLTSRYILPSFSCVTPLSTAPLRGQSPALIGLAPVNGDGRQFIPVQEPVLTAHTKVFSSPSVFSTLVAMEPLLRRWPIEWTRALVAAGPETFERLASQC